MKTACPCSTKIVTEGRPLSDVSVRHAPVDRSTHEVVDSGVPGTVDWTSSMSLPVLASAVVMAVSTADVERWAWGRGGTRNQGGRDDHSGCRTGGRNEPAFMPRTPASWARRRFVRRRHRPEKGITLTGPDVLAMAVTSPVRAAARDRRFGPLLLPCLQSLALRVADLVDQRCFEALAKPAQRDRTVPTGTPRAVATST